MRKSPILSYLRAAAFPSRTLPTRLLLVASGLSCGAESLAQVSDVVFQQQQLTGGTALQSAADSLRTGKYTAVAPIIEALNALDIAIADAFDRDVDSLKFPQAVRRDVLEKLIEIRSGMLAIIHNSSGGHEGQLRDIPKVVPDLRAISASMKDDPVVTQRITTYENLVAPILPIIDERSLKSHR